jgi:hypothetical protein
LAQFYYSKIFTKGRKEEEKEGRKEGKEGKHELKPQNKWNENI